MSISEPAETATLHLPQKQMYLVKMPQFSDNSDIILKSIQLNCITMATFYYINMNIILMPYIMNHDVKFGYSSYIYTYFK